MEVEFGFSVPGFDFLVSELSARLNEKNVASSFCMIFAWRMRFSSSALSE